MRHGCGEADAIEHSSAADGQDITLPINAMLSDGIQHPINAVTVVLAKLSARDGLDTADQFELVAVGCDILAQAIRQVRLGLGQACVEKAEETGTSFRAVLVR